MGDCSEVGPHIIPATALVYLHTTVIIGIGLWEDWMFVGSSAGLLAVSLGPGLSA